MYYYLMEKRVMPSFDIVSKIDMPSVQNALDSVRKEINTRYDFKGRVNNDFGEKNINVWNMNIYLMIESLSLIKVV